VTLSTTSHGRPEVASLLHALDALHRAAQGGALPRTLQGKHLCLLGATRVANAALVFRDAGRELGAQVTELDPERLALVSDHDVARCGRMLGRLYDAVDCEGLAPALVDRLRASAGVPVYDGLALDMRLVACLSGDLAAATPEEQHRRVVQAVLVSALA
jgi:ornithine carbamoyltransferase